MVKIIVANCYALSSAFGIGIILLNTTDPYSSEVHFHSRERENLDQETMNKPATMNSNFIEFISTVKKRTSKRIHKKEYDAVPSPEDMEEQREEPKR